MYMYSNIYVSDIGFLYVFTKSLHIVFKKVKAFNCFIKIFLVELLSIRKYGCDIILYVTIYYKL